jgi:hypothetical protein
MPKLSWSKMMDRHPTAHFIAGVVPEEDVMAASPRQLFGLISKLLTRLRLTGVYAVTVDRQGQTPEIHCAFERESDVAKVAKALHADVVSRYPGWASQRTFRLDDKTRQTVVAALRE